MLEAMRIALDIFGLLCSAVVLVMALRSGRDIPDDLCGWPRSDRGGRKTVTTLEKAVPTGPVTVQSATDFLARHLGGD